MQEKINSGEHFYNLLVTLSDELLKNIDSEPLDAKKATTVLKESYNTFKQKIVEAEKIPVVPENLNILVEMLTHYMLTLELRALESVEEPKGKVYLENRKALFERQISKINKVLSDLDNQTTIQANP